MLVVVNQQSETHRVFCFPKNDYLRNLWVSFIAPTKPHIIALSKEQLLRKRVCEKHFDKYQLDEEGKRLRYSYPCLFTDEEIALGEPFFAPEAGHDILRDHNYCKEQNDDEDLTDTAMVVGRADGVENNHDQLESELGDFVD
ncbi:uncharacterized protein LOC119837969 [Zerene cesonia]|uniref:uncharacterized protein LOC119837969 n=1 Tax=Zerene cesonia TaxID=33412 RepID=UPI0018E5647B|nr:uncharacterized protein LOC119837969 [Zerene cesonia]